MKVNLIIKIVILIISFSGISAQWSFSQNFHVKAFIDSSSIKIGDQLKYHIEIEQPINAKVQFPVINGKIDSLIEVLETFPPDTIKKDNLFKISQDYLITSFDSGVFYIPSFKIPYRASGKQDTLITDSLKLVVGFLPTDTLKTVRDIKAPMKAPLNFAELWPYLLGLLILAGLIFGIWYFYSGRKNGGIFSTPKIQEPPHVIALRELDTLRAKKLWQNNKIKDYYVELSDIIRKYIETRFDILAMEMTTDEIIESFKHINYVEPEMKQVLKEFFTLADLVKFAKAQPLPNENEVSLLNAYQFVNNTKIQETVTDEINNDESSSDQV